MPGDHENVVKLNADHSGVCKFGFGLEDQDNFKLVRSNIKDLYKNALTKSESSVVPSDISIKGEPKAVVDKELQARWAALKRNSS
jgi:hypothetical protein